jgi:hypothetical protein
MRPSAPLLRQSFGYRRTWQAILQLHHCQGAFTRDDLRALTQSKSQTLGAHLRLLVRGGFLAELSQTQGLTASAKVYRLIRAQPDAPKIHVDGSLPDQDSAADQMWRTAKIIKQFSAQDLAIQASTDRQLIALADAQDYCKYLCLAGYLAIIGPQTADSAAVYRFLVSKNTGPQAPVVQRLKAVCDPNLGALVWTSHGGSPLPPPSLSRSGLSRPGNRRRA